MSAKKLFDRLSLVHGGVIEQNNDRPAQMAEQLAQKYANLFLSDVVIEEQIVKPQAMSAGAYGNSRNDGYFVSPHLAVTMNGSLPLRSPGSDHSGNQKEARSMKPDWKTGSLIFTAGFTVERTGRNLQGESIYRRPMGGSARWAS